MKRAGCVALSGVLALACGGGGGGGTSFKNPDQAQFTYETPAAVTAGSSEESAALSSTDGVSAALAVAGETDQVTAQGQALSLMMLSNDAGDVFPGGVPVPFLQAGGGTAPAALTAPERLARGYLAAATAEPWDDPTCVSVVTGQVSFNHCSITEQSDTGTIVIGLNGSLQRANGRAVWDVTMSASGQGKDDTGAAASMSFSDRLSGDLTHTGAAFTGFSRSDISLSLKSSSQDMSAAVTFNTDYDLSYLTDPSFCVTGGTVTLKRLWAKVPKIDGADPRNFTDAALRLSWTGGAADACATGMAFAWSRTTP